MAHKLSFILLGHGSKIRQIHFTRKNLLAAAAAVIVCFALGLYGAVDYLMLRSRTSANEHLSMQISEKDQEVTLQREQLQKFAREINSLKERLVALNHLEDRIRILANLKQADNENEGVFGVGGSTPDDLDPELELNQSHRQLIKDMHKQIRHLEDASQKQQNVFADLLHRLEEQKNMLAHRPAIRPASGRVTSVFAYRQSPFTGKREMHKGIDIANQAGTPISATADGTVSFSGVNGGMGLMVVIDHGHGINTRYAHLQQTHTKRGDRVRRGEQIGLMGNTGRSTGPHLHYEVRVNGIPVNPQKYILN
jgi:murein DD-endopeptidase MepM/ murein hydrolase activator NlpD